MTEQCGLVTVCLWVMCVNTGIECETLSLNVYGECIAV